MSLQSDPRTPWPDYRPTTLAVLPGLAQQLQVANVYAKLENERPLGNFKALGGMTAGLRALARASGGTGAHRHPHSPRSAPHLICASEGNHGLSVAAAAQRAGAKATIYLPANANPIRANRIKAVGGEVHWIDGTYDDAVLAASEAAARGEGLLIPDTSPDPNDPVVRDVMAGYELLTREIRDQLQTPPTHVFVQAGVGGLAAAVANGLSDFMSDPRRFLVVEPESAACVSRALAACRPVSISGDLHTAAEMLACGLASASAIEVLKRHNAHSILVSEPQLQVAVDVLRKAGGPQTTPSGAASLAGLLHAASDTRLRVEHLLTPKSVVLFLVTERAASSTPD